MLSGHAKFYCDMFGIILNLYKDVLKNYCFILWSGLLNVLDGFVMFQMVSLLLVKGANVKAKDRRERIPLHLAAYMGMLTSPLAMCILS